MAGGGRACGSRDGDVNWTGSPIRFRTRFKYDQCVPKYDQVRALGTTCEPGSIHNTTCEPRILRSWVTLMSSVGVLVRCLPAYNAHKTHAVHAPSVMCNDLRGA